MALCRQIIDFVRTYLAHDLHDAHRVAQVGVVQVEVRASLKMRDALAVVHRRAADSAVNIISFLQQELGKVGAVLARDAGD